MVFQICLRINRNTIKTLPVASSHEQFDKFTIRELKRKVLKLLPGINDAHIPRIIYVNSELEDDQTFESYKIKQMSVLIVVFGMPEGEPGLSYEGICKADSMEQLPVDM